MRRVGVDERRARLARRHHLAPAARAAGVVELAGALGGLHATDPAAVVLAARARVTALAAADVERALYDERTVVRMLGMRRTMFVEPVALMPVVQAACAEALVAGERRKVVKLVEAAGLAADGAAWLAAAEAAGLETLAACGEATAAELGRAVPALGRQVVLGAGTRHEARQSIATRVLFLLAAQGLIVRTRPLGSWTSTLNRWAPLDAWLGERAPAPLAEADAAVALARRWLWAFGPGTAADLKWWTGWSAGLLKRTLATLRPAEVALDDGQVGLVLADDVAPVEAPGAWAALLPGLDPTVMGWFERDWFSGRTATCCSTAPATPARRSGGWAAPSAAGRSAGTGRSSTVCSRTSAPTGRRRSPPRSRRWRRGSGRSGHAAVSHPARAGADRYFRLTWRFV